MQSIKVWVKFNNWLIIWFLISIPLILSSCLLIKPGAVKSAKKLYETFFVGEEGTQYFIKPLFFKSSDNDNQIDIDFTFRYKNKIEGTSVINYSFLTNKVIKTLDSLVIENSNYKMTLSKNDLLFNERNKQGFKSRFTTKLPLDQLSLLFNNSNWHINIYFNGSKDSFSPSKRTKKNIKALNYNLFILFDL
jgi:hypothetical protein